MAGTRRPHGSGSIRQRSPGVWELRVFLGSDLATGKPRQVSRICRGGKRAAEAALVALRAEVADGKHGGVAAGTFGALLTKWLDQMEARRRRPTTVETYRQNVEKHIRPALGNVRLKKLTGGVLDDFYTEKSRTLHPNTVRQLHATISAACAQGVKWHWLAANPAALATPPESVKTERPTPTVEEVRRMLEVIEPDPDLSALILLAAIIGARRGELCGLRWSDVNWQAGTIRIARALAPIKGQDVLIPPKAGKTRTEPLNELGVAVLQRYFDIQKERCRQAGDPWSDDQWIFSLDGGLTALRPHRVSACVTKVGKEAGVTPGVVLHSLRHWVGTTLSGAGVDPRTVADILGHSRTSMTMDTYVRALPASSRAAVELLGRLLAPAQVGPGPVDPIGVTGGDCPEGAG